MCVNLLLNVKIHTHSCICILLEIYVHQIIPFLSHFGISVLVLLWCYRICTRCIRGAQSTTTTTSWSQTYHSQFLLPLRRHFWCLGGHDRGCGRVWQFGDGRQQIKHSSTNFSPPHTVIQTGRAGRDLRGQGHKNIQLILLNHGFQRGLGLLLLYEWAVSTWTSSLAHPSWFISQHKEIHYRHNKSTATKRDFLRNGVGYPSSSRKKSTPQSSPQADLKNWNFRANLAYPSTTSSTKKSCLTLNQWRPPSRINLVALPSKKISFSTKDTKITAINWVFIPVGIL